MGDLLALGFSICPRTHCASQIFISNLLLSSELQIHNFLSAAFSRMPYKPLSSWPPWSGALPSTGLPKPSSFSLIYHVPPCLCPAVSQQVLSIQALLCPSPLPSPPPLSSLHSTSVPSWLTTVSHWLFSVSLCSGPYCIVSSVICANGWVQVCMP